MPGVTEKVVLLGAGGFLGSNLNAYFPESGFKIIRQVRKGSGDARFDASDFEQLERLLTDTDPDVILNAIALADVSQCEKYPQVAYLTNARIVKNIGDIIIKHSLRSHLIHVSTDHVYDNIQPSDERSISLTNIYSYSKFLGDIYAERIGATVLRTNFFGRSNLLLKKGLTDWLYGNLVEGRVSTGFRDIFFNPLSLDTLCRLIIEIIKLKPIGVYNLGSVGAGISKAEFCIRFAGRLGFPLDLVDSIESSMVLKEPPRRPKSMVMDCGKVQDELGFELPDIDSEISLAALGYEEGGAYADR